MIRRPPRSTRTCTLLPYTTLFRALVVGFLRVFHGVMGEDFYLHNPWFHAKVGAFALVGLVSICPTVRFLRWRKALKADPAFLPAPAEVGSLHSIVRTSDERGGGKEYVSPCKSLWAPYQSKKQT